MSKKGYKATPEACAKISAALTGKKKSPEHERYAGGDGLSFADLRIYLNGLIKRDVSCPPPPPKDSPYWQTKEGKAELERAEKFKSGDLKMVWLRERGSIKLIEVDRAALRRLVTEGWQFDDETLAWANESKS